MTRAIYLSEVAYGLHPQRSRHKAVAVLYAYLDESGIHDESPVILIGGFVAKQPLWAALEPDWQQRLENQGLTYFHAADCEAGRGVFSDLDRPRRDALFVGLAEVIAQHKPVAIGCALKREHWKAVDPSWRKYFPDPYHMCFEFCMQQLANWTNAENDGEPIALMFAKHDSYESAARQVYAFYEGDKKWAKSFVSLAFGEPKKIVALQTADLIVYEKTKREVSRQANPDLPYRRALDIMGEADVQLISIPHDPQIMRKLILTSLGEPLDG